MTRKGTPMSEHHPFRQAIESGDVELLRDTLHEDVVLHGPVLFRPFTGRDTALQVLANVNDILTDVSYTHEATEPGAVALRFRAQVGDREVEGINFLEVDEDGRVRTVTAFMRPMSALNAFSQQMAERLGIPTA